MRLAAAQPGGADWVYLPNVQVGRKVGDRLDEPKLLDELDPPLFACGSAMLPTPIRPSRGTGVPVGSALRRTFEHRVLAGTAAQQTLQEDRCHFGLLVRRRLRL